MASVAVELTPDMGPELIGKRVEILWQGTEDGDVVCTTYRLLPPTAVRALTYTLSLSPPPLYALCASGTLALWLASTNLMATIELSMMMAMKALMTCLRYV